MVLFACTVLRMSGRKDYCCRSVMLVLEDSLQAGAVGTISFSRALGRWRRRPHETHAAKLQRKRAHGCILIHLSSSSSHSLPQHKASIEWYIRNMRKQKFPNERRSVPQAEHVVMG